MGSVCGSVLERSRSMSGRTALALSAAVLAIPLLFVLVAPRVLDQRIGVDFELYRDVTLRWLNGGSFFEAHQLAGPYEITPGDVLYPPVAIWLFAPWALTFGIPDPLRVALAVLWWAIPLGLTAAAVVAMRPRPWVWPLLSLCASNPTTLLKIWTGNPVMWSMAALALAVAGPSRLTAPFALLKPSLAPFALFGANRRSWWLGLVMLIALAAPFGAMWRDWLDSVVSSRGGGPLYSSLEVPFLLLPLFAWVGRTRGG